MKMDIVINFQTIEEICAKIIKYKVNNVMSGLDFADNLTTGLMDSIDATLDGITKTIGKEKVGNIVGLGDNITDINKKIDKTKTVAKTTKNL